jgi:hypothetical protein
MEVSMKFVAMTLTFTILTLAVVSSFSSNAFAGRRSNQMSGADHTYKSTGKCVGGACAMKPKKKK